MSGNNNLKTKEDLLIPCAKKCPFNQNGSCIYDLMCYLEHSELEEKDNADKR